jgi:hypothetical protein
MQTLMQTLMHTLVRIWDLVTSDLLTLTITGVLAVASLSLLAFAMWPSRSARGAQTPVRSAQARALVALGTPAADIARRTGLSRDALALMDAAQRRDAATGAARQKGSKAAGLSFRWPARRPHASAPSNGQVMA